jgi:hypothetical protein
MIDVEALAVEAGISGVLHREEVARLVCMALEEAARVCEQNAWSNSATPLLGPELGSVKCAAAVRALKPS